jgi:fluoride exporter
MGLILSMIYSKVMIKTYILIAIGGSFGALARFWISTQMSQFSVTWPLGTFAVNVVGCFTLGALLGFFSSPAEIPDTWKALIIIGLLGSFTTFSTFSFELLNFIEKNQWQPFFGYLFSSIIVGLLSLVSGAWITKTLYASFLAGKISS